MPSFSCTVENVPQELRLDRYIAEYLKLLTRSQIKPRNLIARINGKQVKISRAVQERDIIELQWDEALPSELIPENIPLNILYEDERVVVINKAQGMVVHPGAGNRTGTLANALLYRRFTSNFVSDIEEGIGSIESFRPGIVHRLDKDTSGVLIAAYDNDALTFLSDQFKSRKVRKIYAAIVQGIPQSEGIINTFITRDSRNRKKFTVSTNKGKHALTHYKVIRSYGNYSLLLLRPKTGRTHQLRVHLRSIGHPIIGDPIYGNSDSHTLMLHAKSLTLLLPGKRETSTFTTRLPSRFKELLCSLW
jgi:23S rRNA pseudouridine1911/1915/1917 synthase